MTSLNAASIELTIILPYVEFLADLQLSDSLLGVDSSQVESFAKTSTSALSLIRSALNEGVTAKANKDEADFIRRAYSHELQRLDQQAEQRFFITKSREGMIVYNIKIQELRNQMHELDKIINICQ